VAGASATSADDATDDADGSDLDSNSSLDLANAIPVVVDCN